MRTQIAALTSLLAILSVPAPSQVAEAPVTVLQANARLVVLDVVVTGPDGKPVTGLTREDFKIYESGVLEPIQSFEAPDAHKLPPDTANATIYDPARPASFGNAPINILVLDQTNTHYSDSAFARTSLHNYLAKQPAILALPTTLLTVTDAGFSQLKEFTRDRDQLLHALDTMKAKYPWKLELQGKTDYGPIERLDQSLRALEQMTQTYALIPGRKNILWAGAGFPTVDPTILTPRDAREVADAMHRLTSLMLSARMALYAVDPTSTAAGMTEVIDSTQMEFVQQAGDGLTGNSDPFSATDDFDKFGPATGGRVIRGHNDLTGEIARSLDLGGTYYSLAYRPDSTSDSKASFRSIRVICSRPGLTATTRTGYYNQEPSSGQPDSTTLTRDLTTAAEADLPLNGLRVTAERDHAPNSSPTVYIAHVSASMLTWRTRSDGSSMAATYILAAALDSHGKLIRETTKGMTATAGPAARLNDEATYADFFVTAPSLDRCAVLRLVVRDSATGRMGSYDIPLTKK